MLHRDVVRELIRRARARWRALTLFHALVRGALAAAAIVGLALIAARFLARAPMSLAITGLIACALAVAALVRALLPLRKAPSDVRVARFVEERVSLDDRLVTAVDVLDAKEERVPPAFVEPMLADAAA